MKSRWSLVLAAALALTTGQLAEAQTVRLADVLMAASHGEHGDRQFTRWVQRQLRHYSYYSGPIDGIWGPQTEAAIDLANRAAQPHVFNLVEEPGASGQARLIPVAPAFAAEDLGLVPVNGRVTIPHVPATVPSAFAWSADRGALRYDLIARTDTAQRYETVFVDRADGYRVIAPSEVVVIHRH